jgi:hypothetical protein
MKMTDFYKENYIPCEISPPQAHALEGFCEALRSFYEDAEAIPPQTAESALRALVEVSQCQESDQSHQHWRSMRSPATRLAGITVLVKNESGDELMLQLDADGYPHIGTWTLFDEEGMPRHMVLFEMIQGSTGWTLRLDNASETAEILIGESPGDLNWTHQPDYQLELETDDIIDESSDEVSDEAPEEKAVNADPLQTKADGIENELSQASVEPDYQNHNRKQELQMSENEKLPPKIPPQRVKRRVEPGFSGPEYRQEPPPTPPEIPGKTNTLAIVSLIMGILSLLTMLSSICLGCLGFVAFLFGIVGAVTGYLAKKRIDESGGSQSSRKMAVTGMIMGLTGVVLSIIVTVIVGIFYGGLMVFSDFY